MQPEKTNIKGMRDIAKMFLNLPIQHSEIGFILYHPIFTTSTLSFPSKDNEIGFEVYDLDKKEDLKKAIEMYEKEIDKSNLVRLYMLIRDPYKLAYIKYCLEDNYLSEKDLAHYFADAWVLSENPNQDKNCPISWLIKTFKLCNKKILMESEDYKTYCNLPEEITVYRGVAVGRNPYGLSWTPTLSKAEWFANRFNTNNKKGYIQKAVIKKEEVLAYFNTRNEDEIVVKVPKNRIEKIKIE